MARKSRDRLLFDAGFTLAFGLGMAYAARHLGLISLPSVSQMKKEVNKMSEKYWVNLKLNDRRIKNVDSNQKV